MNFAINLLLYLVNIGVVCKLFYLQVLKEEIVSSGNFIHSDKTVKNIVEDYSSLIEENYNNLCTHLRLPIVHWIPKFHKTLTEFRFITSGKHTVINTLSKKIAIGLQSMLKLEKTRCKFNHKFDGIKNDYIIDSNKEVIDFMIVSNLLNPGNKYIKTFDFKTLYTKIPHNKLKENLKIFISSVFSFKKKQYINIDYKTAQFSDKPNKYCFNENNFINHISYLIDN